jgi:ribosomal protein L37AE/L43A
MDLKMQLVDNTGKRVIHVNEGTTKVCPKCGSENVGIKIAGEPIYFCKDCGAYVDDVPFNEQMGAAMGMAPVIGLDKADAYITLEPKENNVFSATVSALDGKNRYGL